MNRDFCKINRILGPAKAVTTHTELVGCTPVIREVLDSFGFIKEPCENEYRKVVFTDELSSYDRDKIAERFGVPRPFNTEGHFVFAEGDEILVYGQDPRALLYGAVSLLHLAEGSEIKNGFYYSAPICQERGMKVFVPARKDISFFKRFVDMLTYFKFNQVMIEVGGAMEYKRHPEINSGWIEYCGIMGEYSGKTKEIQEFTYPWYKNAIHMENGGGNYLTQEEMRELVAYCKDRHMEVIPEVPSLGHCDYLLMGHPEINERPEDPYPDTYCPSNPKSYEILFDVIDEIVDVFEPTAMNIGHDEYYTIGICEKCRKRNADDIFADDVNKIAAYLKKKNVETIIWGDKLIKNAVTDSGPFGGAEIKMYLPSFRVKDGKFVGIMPATYKAIDKVSKEVKILHWFWPLGKDLEDEVLDAGFDTRYGNFDSYLFADWHMHMKKPIKGAMISNWSSLNETILQRNGIFFNVSYAYEMFWNPDFDETDFDEFRKQTFIALYRYKNPVIDTLEEASEESAPAYIELLYTTDLHIDFKWFVDGVFPEEKTYRIGNIVFEYKDGSAERLPVIYGENIGYQGVSWERKRDATGASYLVDDHLYETTYNTCPEQYPDGTYYRYLVRNPRPDKELLNVSAEFTKDDDHGIRIRELRRLVKNE